jgi:hypothetical protein
MTLTCVDSEQVVRTWARAETNINAAVSGRVFFGTPQKYADLLASLVWPAIPAGLPNSWIVLSLVSEVHEDNDLGMQQPLVQFTVWGTTKAIAAAAAIAVQNAGRQLEWGPPVPVDSAVIQSGSVSQRRWFPDSSTNLPRYVVDLLFTIRGTATS